MIQADKHEFDNEFSESYKKNKLSLSLFKVCIKTQL